MSWTERAACDQRAGFSSDNPDHVSWCRGCPVIAQCSAWARTEPDFTGVAGGAWWRDGRIQPAKREWSEHELLQAHTAYGAGARDLATLAGQREYDRRRKQIARASVEHRVRAVDVIGGLRIVFPDTGPTAAAS